MSSVAECRPRVALAGHPNCGKTALFNALTGGRAKVGNYAGVTVEKKEGWAKSCSGKSIEIIDLPGTYSLNARTPDEKIAEKVLLGQLDCKSPPNVLIVVADATNLHRSLGFAMELKQFGAPTVIALNMMDLAQQRGLEIDLNILERELGVPVIPTVATQKKGVDELIGQVEKLLCETEQRTSFQASWAAGTLESNSKSSLVRNRFAELDRILSLSITNRMVPDAWTDRIDRFVLHPFWGSVLFVGIITLVFQTIFAWAQIPMEWIRDGVSGLGSDIAHYLPEGPLQSLIVDGVFSGVGSVLVFLPQILFLFLFILILEDSGYMARVAFLMDRIMGKVGLHGKAFIPLLSSYACAIPGIMATRTIENRRDRLVTILIAPLMTCSARLPVYSLLIAAFIPNQKVAGFGLQGLVLLGLYFMGVVTALLMAIVFRSTLLKGAHPAFLMELPSYKWPSAKNILIALFERCKLFVRRAGTVILAISVILWFLSSYPKPPSTDLAVSNHQPAISYSYAGRIGKALEPLVSPIGFNWRIAVALIPGFAAREVMVSSLATVYAVEEGAGDQVELLGGTLKKNWSIATALSLLVWYVLACQCLSTLAVARRETNSWRWPAFMLFYMTSLAYFASFITYHLALKGGLGS